MSDLIQLNRGALPWTPTFDAEFTDELDRYDMPLLGIIRQSGSDYLMRCLLGQLGDLSLWCYVLLDAISSDSLRHATGSGVDEIVDNVTRGNVMVALADAAGIVLWDAIDVPPDTSDGVLLNLAAARLQDTAQQISDDTRELGRAVMA